MKKIFIFHIAVLFSTVTWSQDQPISWNIKAGINISNFTSGDDIKAKVGFRGGIGMEYKFTEMWSLQPSLLYSSKGTKIKGDVYQTKINANYLQLPVMGAARLNLSENTKIVISAGPYFAIGIGGKTIVTMPNIADDKVDTFGGEGAKRFDFGLGIGAALEYYRFIFSLDGELGLTKVMNIDTAKPRNITFAIALGYRFW